MPIGFLVRMIVESELLSNAKKNVEKKPLKLALFTASYKELRAPESAPTARHTGVVCGPVWPVALEKGTKP